MKVLAAVFLCILIANDARGAQNDLCVNPNDQAGLCVPIEECKSLYSVLQEANLTKMKMQFLKASSCGTGADNRPFVCCTQDTSYNAQRLSTPRPWRQSVATNGSSLWPNRPICGSIPIRDRIYDGKDADLNEFPWMVLMEYRRLSGNGLSAECAGSLINQRYVLTAAHCLTGRIEWTVGPLASVLLGVHDTRSAEAPGLRLGLEEITVHKLYRDPSRNHIHDIGLVRLERNVRYSDSIRPICLPGVVGTESRQAGQQFTVAGWGRTTKMAKSPVKQKLDVDYVEPARCRQRFARININVEPTQICAGGDFNKDSCYGDSGGPLMRFRNYVWVLEGIVSFGYRCGLMYWPAVYTNVTAYDIWIRQNVRT